MIIKDMSEKKDQNNRLFLLDAYALMYRSFLPLSRTPGIVPKVEHFGDAWVYQYARITAFEDKPTHVAVVFDVNAPTFRHEIILL
jgi:DNA polymerase-1